MHKRFYVTQKQVLEYILLSMHKFESTDEFKEKVQLVIEDLSEYPDDNRCQLKFFKRVQLALNDVVIT
jgi:hypothetical protein